jgi:drug/metabolite transporter (DMT)-like permease
MKAHVALFCVSLLYGANYLIAKGVMPHYLEPSAFIALRVTGALILFGTLALILKEKIARKDMLRFAGCGLFGVAVNQTFFFEGLSRTSAMNSSILMTLNPIMVMLMAAFFLKERITILKGAGILIGAAGAAGIITFSNLYGSGNSSLKGDIFVLINALSYAIYLVMVKPLMRKYKPVTVATMIFAFGFLFVIPYSMNTLSATDFGAIPGDKWLSITYVILGTTFLAYLFNVFALQRVSPSVVSAYIYLQPLAAFAFVLIFQADSGELDGLSVYHLLFALMIFTGVYLVSFEKSKSVQPKDI